MDIVKFWTICSANSIILDKSQIENFERYHKELIYWNEKVNLISRSDIENIFERHFLHSLSILKYENIKKKARCLDFGTGAGFPGLPLKIAKPDIYMTLVDSIKKKIKITEIFAKHTGLKNIDVICSRVEDLKNDKNINHKFDYIFARAVSRLDNLIAWSKELLKPDGKMMFLKGGNLEEEINNSYQKFPNIKIEEIQIDIFGAEWFKNEEKKILVVRF